MVASTYSRLPSKFDFRQYYLSQAAGGPTFPVFRARQRGGFLFPILKKHGIRALKWLGRQAAELGTSAGNAYLEKGSLSKDEMKGMLKTQGKKAAKSALDSIRQQIGSGPTMNQRRDGRLAALLPQTTRRKEGAISALHSIRPPLLSEHSHSLGSPPEVDRLIGRIPQKRKSKKRRKTVAKSKKTKRTSKSTKKSKQGKKSAVTSKSGKKKKKKEKAKSDPETTIFSKSS